MRTWILQRLSALLLYVLVLFHLLGILTPAGLFTPDRLLAQERDTNRTGRPVMGRVLSAADAKPLAGVVLTLAGQRATTDAGGRFTFAQPPTGYQLITIQHGSLDAYRKPLKNGAPGGLMHADPVLVNVASDKAFELPDPIWVVQTHAVSYPMTPGQRTDIKVTASNIPVGSTFKLKHIPQFALAAAPLTATSTGTLASSTATFNVTLPVGQVSVLKCVE